MDNPPAPSVSNTASEARIPVCSVCEWVFHDLNIDLINQEDASKQSHNLSRLRASDLLKPDALHCPLCSSVNSFIRRRYGERCDLNLTVSWSWQEDEYTTKLLYIMYTVEDDSENRAPAYQRQILRRLQLESYSQPGAALPRPASTNSEACTLLATHWLHDCVTTHEKCRSRHQESSWLPTRLIDLHSHPRLILTADLQLEDSTPAYICLSHLWAASGTMLKLNLANLNRFLHEIPMAALPPTFKDTFDVTRKLGVRYLWIDSLCIVQDSDADWRAESSVMGKIYGQSLCNIAATGSSQTHGGLFQGRDISKIPPATISIKSKGQETTYCFPDNKIWCSEITNAPLNSRGWVLQERLLSPRTLHYASQLFWECRTMEACETYPSGLSDRWCEPIQCSKFTNHPLGLKGWKDKSSDNQWDQIIQSYTACRLTRTSDRLIAIAGIAMDVQLLWGDYYLAGLWKNHLPRCLLWEFCNSKGRFEKLERYRCPSWSWASLNFESAEIYFPSPEDVKTELVKVVDAQMYGKPNSFGDFTGGIIKLEGRVGRIFPTSSSYQGEYINGYSSYEICFDINKGIVEAVPWCIPIAIEYGKVAQCLMLRPVDEQNLSFTRIGLVHVSLDLEADIPHELQWIKEYALMERTCCNDLTVVTII